MMQDTARFETTPSDSRNASSVASQTQQLKAQKRVSFARTVRITLVPALSEMTDAEMSAAWYSDDDSAALEEDVVRNVRALRRGHVPSDDEETVCARGLEHMRSPQHISERKFLKTSVVRAVLTQQYHQRRVGAFDQEAVACASASRSRVAADLALTLAAADEGFVRRTVARRAAPRPLPNSAHLSVLERALALSRVPEGGAVHSSSAQGAAAAATRATDRMSHIGLVRSRMLKGLQDEALHGGGRRCAQRAPKSGN